MKLIELNLNMEREVSNKDFALVAATAAAAGVAVFAKYGADIVVSKLKERRARKEMIAYVEKDIELTESTIAKTKKEK